MLHYFTRNLSSKVRPMSQATKDLCGAIMPSQVDDDFTQQTLEKNGRKNQAVTKPIALDASTGEVLVRKSTGKTKVRKGQSPEEYAKQKDLFFNEENGPIRTEVGWMDSIDISAMTASKEYDVQLKQVRQKLSSHCHRLYFQRRYQECVVLCETLIELYIPVNKKNKIQKELEELEYMLQKSKAKI